MESILRAEFERAIRCQEQRVREYREVLLHVSHSQSSCADADRVQEAFLQELEARNAMWRATQRLSDFENFGWIPEELERSPKLVSASHA